MPIVAPQHFTERMIAHLPPDPTAGQLEAVNRLSEFLSSPDQGIFLLKGYAGTGKTTLVSALTHAVNRFVLLAPTGRAAKVMSSYSGFPASTIHRHIYKVTSSEEGSPTLLKADNKQTSVIYIVDESSMIGNEAGWQGSRGLLEDLIDFVNKGVKCRLILAGDTAQLPPVSQLISPALDHSYVASVSHRNIAETELKEVVRQKESSGILMNATALRILIKRNATLPILKTEGFGDIQAIYGNDISECLEASYNKAGIDDVIVITRSNKMAVQYNQLIRRQFLSMEDELGSGDRMMVVKNNYYYHGGESKSGFIANGDTVEIRRVYRIEERHGFRFAYALLQLVDYREEVPFEAWMLLNTIYSDSPSLGRDDSQKLYESVAQEYIHESRGERRNKLRNDPYLNALQVKFAYAVTCHKAQGGQWNTVFVDQGYMTDETQTTSHLRWLYTAFTRATDHLYLVNFNEALFKKSNEGQITS